MANTDTEITAFSSADQRMDIARHIVNFEARRDSQNRIRVYELPGNDGGGSHEVAGLNSRYHPAILKILVRLIRSGRHAEAEEAAAEYIAEYTDRVDRWCRNVAIEAYLRDSCFNRGPGGAAKILQIAVGVTVDGRVGPNTRRATARAEENPTEFLRRLREAREIYERDYIGRRENLWDGLVNRWNKARRFSEKFLTEFDSQSRTGRLSVGSDNSNRRERDQSSAPTLTPIPTPVSSQSSDVSAEKRFFSAFKVEKLSPKPADGRAQSLSKSSFSLEDYRAAKKELRQRYRSDALPASAMAFASGAASSVSSNPAHNIVGFSLGERLCGTYPTGEMAVRILVANKLPLAQLEKDFVLPKEIHGIPVDVEEVGHIFPQNLPNPQLQYAQLMGGMSISDPNISAGTLGTMVEDGANQTFLLTNSHVIADNGNLPAGSDIYQQGLMDLQPGQAERQVGRLVSATDYNAHNLDAALGYPNYDIPSLPGVMHIGVPQGQRDALLHEEVHKFGRTTSYTAGRVTSLESDIIVNYPSLGGISFEDQLEIKGLGTKPFSDRGDSGSLIMSRTFNEAVGLLFAGNGVVTFANPILKVLEHFGVRLKTS